jgi:hypothetical protein
MSGEPKEFPTVKNLEAAAWLCLKEAAWTDLDRFPPGSGIMRSREFHERRDRFKEAAAKLEAGADIQELGLSSEDFAWVASMAHRAVDKEGWRRRFEAAAEEVKEPEPAA